MGQKTREQLLSPQEALRGARYDGCAHVSNYCSDYLKKIILGSGCCWQSNYKGFLSLLPHFWAKTETPYSHHYLLGYSRTNSFRRGAEPAV
jgi:hypothetical protein